MANNQLKLKGDVRTDDDFLIQLKLLRPSCTEQDTLLTIAPAFLTKGNGQVTRAYVSSKKPSQFSGQTIDLSSYTGSVPSNFYVKALVTIDADDALNVILGTPAAALIDAVEPTTSNYPIALLNLHKTGASLDNITNDIFEDRRPLNQNGGADIIEKAYEMMSEQYLAQLYETFIAQPDTDDNSVDFSANQTTLAQYASQIMKLNYSERSATIAGGTSVTLSSAPSFTVRQNCWIRLGSDFARISSVATQQSFTLATSLPNGPATVMVLEPVISKDLYTGVGSASEGTRIIDTFSDNVDNILVDYDDSAAANDLNFDDGTPNVICLASTNDIDNFVEVLRPTTKSGLVSDVTVSPAAQALRLVFLPNITSGDGFVNLLGYTCMFLRDQDVYRGGIFNQAFGFTDGGSGLNCVFSLEGGKTVITLNSNFSSYVPNVNPLSPYGDIIVEDAGIEIPRRTVGVTDDTLPYYVELSPNKIELWGDFSTPAARRQISIVRRFGTKDTSDDNGIFIANLKNSGFVFASVIVGSSTDVLNGLAHFDSIQDAHDSLSSSGGKIFVRTGTYTENLVFTKPIVLEGMGRNSLLDGTLQLDTGSDYSSLKHMKFGADVTLDSDACFINEVWLANGFSVLDNGIANQVNYIIE